MLCGCECHRAVGTLWNTSRKSGQILTIGTALLCIVHGTTVLIILL